MMNQIKNAAKLIMIIGVFTFSSSIFAQQHQKGQGERPKGPPPIPSSKQIQKMVDKMAEEVLLSETQEEEVLTLYTSHFEEVESKMESGRPDRDDMQSFKEEFENEVKAVLTDEQEVLYAEFLEKNRKDRSGKERRNK